MKRKKEESTMSLHPKATKPNFNVVGVAVFGGNCRSQNANGPFECENRPQSGTLKELTAQEGWLSIL